MFLFHRPAGDVTVEPDFDDPWEDVRSIGHDIAIRGAVQADALAGPVEYAHGARAVSRAVPSVYERRQMREDEEFRRMYYNAEQENWEWDITYLQRRKKERADREWGRRNVPQPEALWSGEKAVLFANMRNRVPDLTAADFERMWNRSRAGRLRLTDASDA